MPNQYSPNGLGSFIAEGSNPASQLFLHNDGGANQSTRINNAIAEAASRQIGLQLGPGKWNVQSPVDIPNTSGFILSGFGKAATNVTQAVGTKNHTALVWQGGVDATADIFRIGARYGTIKNLSLWGRDTGQTNGDHQPRSACRLNHVSGVGTGHLLFEEVAFSYCENGFDAGTTNGSKADCNFINCEFGFANAGFRTREQQSVNFTLNHPRFTNCDDCIVIDGGGHISQIGVCGVVETNRFLVVNGTHPDVNFDFDFGYVFFDGNNPVDPQLVVCTNTQANYRGRVHFRHVNTVAAIPAGRTLPYFDLWGSVQCIVDEWKLTKGLGGSTPFVNFRAGGGAGEAATPTLEIRDSQILGWDGATAPTVTNTGGDLGGDPANRHWRLENCRGTGNVPFATLDSGNWP